MGNPHELSDEDCQLVLNWLISIYETTSKEHIDALVDAGKTVDITIKPGAEIADRYNKKAGTDLEFLGGCSFVHDGECEIEIAREAVDNPELLKRSYSFEAYDYRIGSPTLGEEIEYPWYGDEILAHELRHVWQYNYGGETFNNIGFLSFLSDDKYYQFLREQDAQQFNYVYLFMKTGIRRAPSYWVEPTFWIYTTPIHWR